MGGTRYAITLSMTAGENVPIRGIEMMEPLPRRINNIGQPFETGGLDIYSTDDPVAALSSDFLNVGWNRIFRGRVAYLQMSLALVPYFASRILFDKPVTAKYLRLVFSTLPNYT